MGPFGTGKKRAIVTDKRQPNGGPDYPPPLIFSFLRAPLTKGGVFYSEVDNDFSLTRDIVQNLNTELVIIEK